MRKKCLSCFLIILLAVQSLLLLSSCAEKPDSNPSVTMYENPFHTFGREYQVYGNYVYWCANSRIFRYDINTFERKSACFDPECNEDCILYEVQSISGIRDGKLFFTTFATDIERDEYNRPIGSTNRSHYAYQDLHTGEVKVLRTRMDAEIDDEARGQIIFDDTHIYYYVNLLKKDGDPLDSDDYIRTYCRSPLSGGREEVLFPIAENSFEGMLTVYDGELIVTRNDVISAYHLQTGAFREIFNYENSEFLMKPHTFMTGKGKLYFLGKVGVLPGTTPAYYDSALVELDLKTGEYRKIIESKVYGYHVDNEGIYYFRLGEVREIAFPEYGDLKTVCYTEDTMYRCDHDGKNETAVFRNPDINIGSPLFLVANGSVYARLVCSSTIRYFEMPDGTGEYRATIAFRKIDLASGKIIDPIIPEEE